MRQCKVSRVLGSLCILFLICASGCGKNEPGGIDAKSAGTIICLTPAGSSLLVAMGLKPRVVAVSSYEADPELKLLPKVGDYEHIDWERVLSLKPGCLIVQGKKDRLPPGVRERCEDNGIAIAILQIDRLDDISAAATQLGMALHAEAGAAKVVSDLKSQAAAFPKPATPTPAMIVLSESGTAVVGRENYLNDLLVAAGGENVITANGYATIDREKLLSLKPHDVFLLMPHGTDAMTENAKSMIDLPAVREGRLHVITDDDALLPGANVMTLAKKFSDGMNGK